MAPPRAVQNNAECSWVTLEGCRPVPVPDQEKKPAVPRFLRFRNPSELSSSTATTSQGLSHDLQRFGAAEAYLPPADPSKQKEALEKKYADSEDPEERLGLAMNLAWIALSHEDPETFAEWKAAALGEIEELPEEMREFMALMVEADLEALEGHLAEAEEKLEIVLEVVKNLAWEDPENEEVAKHLKSVKKRLEIILATKLTQALLEFESAQRSEQQELWQEEVLRIADRLYQNNPSEAGLAQLLAIYRQVGMDPVSLAKKALDLRVSNLSLRQAIQERIIGLMGAHESNPVELACQEAQALWFMGKDAEGIAVLKKAQSDIDAGHLPQGPQETQQLLRILMLLAHSPDAGTRLKAFRQSERYLKDLC